MSYCLALNNLKRVHVYMNNHIYSTLFKIQERKSDRRSREIEQRKESQNTHTNKTTRTCELNLRTSSKYVTEVYDKRMPLINFPYMSSNVPANPTYGVYISQLIRISTICDTFQSFVIRHRLLTERLIKQGFWYKWCKFFRKFVRRYNASTVLV